MSTTLDARRKLQQHGQTGNWRFKGLMLAALPGSGVRMEDVAEAWPSQRSDYRFLEQNPNYDAEFEAKRSLREPEETEAGRMLSAFADDAVEAQESPDGQRYLSGHADSVIKRTLFAASTPEEVDTLFREQLLETVIEGAAPRQNARQGAFVQQVDTKKGDIPRADDRVYADTIAEGAAIEDDREGYDTVPYSCEKHAQGARITDEMVDHALVDAIERQVQWIGAAVENAINRQFLNTLVDDAGQSYDANGSDLGVPALNGGVGEVDKQDFMPDTFASHPQFRTELFNDSNLVQVNRAGQSQELRDRELARIMGVEHLPFSGGTYDSGSNTWDYTSADDIGGVVYQQDMVNLVVYQDISVRDYEDPVRDLQGVNARAWTDTVYGQEDAAAQLLHSTS